MKPVARAPHVTITKTTFKDRTWRVMKKAGFAIIKRLERLIIRFSLVGDTPFVDTHDFPWVADLEANWHVIRTELDEILKDYAVLPNFQDISKDQIAITTDDKWKTFFLYAFDYKSERNCRRCPETTRLVEQVPGMKTVFFSILAPGKHIPPHRGAYKGLLRCHLGLLVPEPKAQCRMRVGHEVRHWEEGKCVIFDDTYEHEIRNDTDGRRVVLFMDIVRPFKQPVALLNKVIITLVGWSPLVQNAIKNHAAWERRMEQM